MFGRQSHSLVIVDNFYIVRVRTPPSKADAPLVVDANAVEPLSGAPQRLQPIAGRHDQILECLCSMQVQELPPCLPLDRAKLRDYLVVE